MQVHIQKRTHAHTCLRLWKVMHNHCLQTVSKSYTHTRTLFWFPSIFFLRLEFENMEAHSLSAVGRGSVLLPEWTEFQSGMWDWWTQLLARWWMGGMKKDSSERSAVARSTGDIIIQKDGRLLQAEYVCQCVCVCVFTFIPYCVEMTEEKGKRVRHWQKRESLHDCWLYVYKLVRDLVPLAERLWDWAKLNLFSSYFSWKVEFEPGIECLIRISLYFCQILLERIQCWQRCTNIKCMN